MIAGPRRTASPRCGRRTPKPVGDIAPDARPEAFPGLKVTERQQPPPSRTPQQKDAQPNPGCASRSLRFIRLPLSQPVPQHGLSGLAGVGADTSGFLTQAARVHGGVRQFTGMPDEPAFQPVGVGFGMKL